MYCYSIILQIKIFIDRHPFVIDKLLRHKFHSSKNLQSLICVYVDNQQTHAVDDPLSILLIEMCY